MNDIHVREIALGELPIAAHIYGQSFDEPYPEVVATSLLRTPGAWCLLATSMEAALVAIYGLFGLGVWLLCPSPSGRTKGS